MSYLVFVLILLLPLPIHAQTTEASVSSQAHAKYDAGDLDQAKTLFTEFLERFPSSSLAPDAQYFLGWIAHKKNTGDAEKVWQTVVDKYPQSPEAPKALMSIGAVHYKAKMDRVVRTANRSRTCGM